MKRQKYYKKWTIQPSPSGVSNPRTSTPMAGASTAYRSPGIDQFNREIHDDIFGPNPQPPPSPGQPLLPETPSITDPSEGGGPSIDLQVDPLLDPNAPPPPPPSGPAPRRVAFTTVTPTPPKTTDQQIADDITSSTTTSDTSWIGSGDTRRRGSFQPTPKPTTRAPSGPRNKPIPTRKTNPFVQEEDEPDPSQIKSYAER